MSSSLKNTTVNDTGYLNLPVGTTNQRPTVSFTTVGTTSWVAPPGVTSVAVLVVGGGGGGGGCDSAGANGTGGGGAGGVVYNSSFSVTPGNSYTVTVGAGGTPGTGTATGGTGSNSVFSTLTAYGGGGGGSSSHSTTAYQNGANGASGGGSTTYSSIGTAGSAIYSGSGNAGNNGGTASITSPAYGGGGGGGAGAAGSNGSSSVGGNGGAGVSYSISGISAYYGGGGGGGTYSGTYNGGAGGAGGGGYGVLTGNGVPGSINTGGGGGGTSGNVSGYSGGAGGSGIVIVSWTAPAGGTIRVNTSTRTIESYTGLRNQPSLGSTGWTPSGQALQNLQASGLVTNGLACLLDAGNVTSYPGTGNVWYDISGNNRHFYVNSSFAAWTSSGTASYFTISGGSNSSRDQAAFIGPASDSWGFDQEHFFEFVVNNVASTVNQIFMFSANGKNQDPYGAGNLLQSHWYYSNGNTYYDVYGCCGGQQRVYVSNNVWGAPGVIQHLSYRTRVSEYPNRSIFHNSSTVIDSGQNPTDTAFWDKQDPAILFVGSSAKVYYIAIYNRALTDTERAANYAVLQSRYGIS